MNDTEIIRSYYDKAPEFEWERLARHPIEFEITRRYLERYIHAGDTVLDVGGGPGRYSIHLAKRGCDVTLVDLSSGNAALAREKAREAGVRLRALAGDAREVDTMRLGDGEGDAGGDGAPETFDHVLLMGPLYHLLTEADRERAVAACLKRLKPNGTLFASFITSYAGMIYSMKLEPDAILDPDLRECYELFAEDRAFAGTGFTRAYMERIGDIAPFFERFPLTRLHVFSQEGLLMPNEETLLTRPPEVLQAWIDLAARVCEREDLLSWAEHVMYVGRKREA